MVDEGAAEIYSSLIYVCIEKFDKLRVCAISEILSSAEALI